MPSIPRLSIVIVNYACWPDTERLTASLAGTPEVVGGLCEVIVVDNASPGPIPRYFLNPPAGVRLSARVSNDGFAAGVNAGWRASLAPWILLLNPDIELGADFLAKLFDRLDHYETRPNGSPGIVGYALRNSDGSRQGSIGVKPSFARCVVEPLIPRTRRKYQPASRDRSGPVPWVTGACALVRSELLGRLGGMDDDFFLYYEEVALCESARRAGWSVEFDPALEAVHHSPLHSRPLTPRMRVITRHSKLLYFRKYLPRRQFEALTRLVRFEAIVRRSIASLIGNREEASAWRTISELSRRLRRPGLDFPRGREVLALADSIVRRDSSGPSAATRREHPTLAGTHAGKTSSRKGLSQ